MTHKKIYHRHPYSSKAIILLFMMLLQLHTITMLTVVVNSSSSSSSDFEDAKSESLLISSKSSGSKDGRERNWSSSSEGESLSKEVAAPLLTFSLKPRIGNNSGNVSLKQSNPDNNAGIHKAKVGASQQRAVEASSGERRGELDFYSIVDNEGDNNDSNVSSESDTDVGEGGLGRFRRDEAGGGSSVPLSPPEGAARKAISTNWGTYEEQAPVVVHSGRSSASVAAIDESDATGGIGRMETDAHDVYDDDSYAYGDEYQSKENENDSSEFEGASESSISYDDDYEGGRRFEGRQFYPSQASSGNVNGNEQHESSGYYRQQYYATTRPLSQQQIMVGQGKQQQPAQQTGYRRPGYRNRFGQQRPNTIIKYRQPQQPKENDDNEEEEESTGGSLMGFFQKAKTFYDIFQAMNSAWKTVEEHYRKNNKGVFPQDLKHLNQSTQTAPNTANQSVNNNTRKMNTKRLRTTRVPITSTTEEDQPEQQQQQHQQQDTWQEKEEYRSRRSWMNETANDNKESTFHIAPSKSNEDDSQITESDLATDSSASASASASSSSSSSTAIAEGRYIKGDPLKGYYDFVITEGSYKFWAVFQVGTALLIIYSTFAAIYYSKVNPLVSDYDYVDYLGGGRSLSDDSDFVDMDGPMGSARAGGASATDGSETTPPEGVSRNRQQQQEQSSSSAGWIGLLPHAGHTLRFILESIDKVYNEE